MRITLTPVPDDCTDTDTVDEDDLRYVAEMWLDGHVLDNGWRRTAQAIAAARPKPRIHPQPGDVLRFTNGRMGEWTVDRRGFAGVRWENDNFQGFQAHDGLDPAEWDHVTAAELAELFDRKRAQS